MVNHGQGDAKRLEITYEVSLILRCPEDVALFLKKIECEV